jgi:hypothetical protein
MVEVVLLPIELSVGLHKDSPDNNVSPDKFWLLSNSSSHFSLHNIIFCKNNPYFLNVLQKIDTYNI